MLTREQYDTIVKEEGDLHYFNYNGVACKAIRHYELHTWNGYICIPQHLCVLDKDSVKSIFRSDRSITYFEIDNKHYVIGFDCMGSNDFIPDFHLSLFGLTGMYMNVTYRTLDYVKEQLHSMVDNFLHNEISDIFKRDILLNNILN